MQKKFMAWLLTLCLVLSLVPVSLSAKTTVEENTLAIGETVSLADDDWSGMTPQTYLPMLARGQIYAFKPDGKAMVWYDGDSTVDALRVLDESVSIDVVVKVRDTEPYTTDQGSTYYEIATSTGVQYRVGGNGNSGTPFTVDGTSVTVSNYDLGIKQTWDGTFKEIGANIAYDNLASKTAVSGGVTYTLIDAITAVGEGQITIGALGASYQYEKDGETYKQRAPWDLAGISVVKNYTVDGEEKSYTVFAWGDYSENQANWENNLKGESLYSTITSESYVPVSVGTTSYTLGKTLAAGEYSLSGFKVGGGELDVEVLADGARVGTVTLNGEDGKITFYIEDEIYVDELTLKWNASASATNLFVNGAKLKYEKYAVAMDNAAKWTGASNVSEDYVTTTLMGGGYGLAAIKIYDPADAANSLCTPGTAYKFYIDVRRTAGNTDIYQMSIGMSPNGYSADRFYTKNFKVNDAWATISDTFTIPADVTTVEVIKIVQTATASSTLTDWDFRGIKIVEAANEDNIVYALGCYDTSLSPEEWVFPLHGSNAKQKYVHDEYISANLAADSAVYDLGQITLAPGLYQLSGDFFASAGTVDFSAYASGVKMTVGAAESTTATVGTAKSSIEFRLKIEEETTVDEITLALAGTAGGKLCFSNLKFECVALIGHTNLDRGDWLTENGSVDAWSTDDGTISSNIDKWWNFANLNANTRLQTTFDAKFTDYPNDRFTGYVIMRHNGEPGTTVNMTYRHGAGGFERKKDITTEWAEYTFNTGGMYNSNTGLPFGTTEQHNTVFLQPTAGTADVDIRGIKIVKTNAADSSIKEVVYAWGEYANDYTAHPTLGDAKARFFDESTVKLTPANGGSTFKCDVSGKNVYLPAGTYLIRADIKSATTEQEVTFSASTVDGISASSVVSVDIPASPKSILLTVDKDTSLADIEFEVHGSDTILVNNISIIKGGTDISIPNTSAKGWSDGVEYVDEEYVTATLLGGGYGLSEIKLYDPDNASGSIATPGTTYKYYVNIRRSAADISNTTQLLVVVSPSGYQADNIHLKYHTTSAEWAEYSGTFTIPADGTPKETMKIVPNCAVGTYTTWDMLGVKIVEADNENNVIYALGCYDTSLEPSEWTFPVSGTGTSQTFHSDKWLAADASLGSVAYDPADITEVILERGVYQLKGQFWTDAGSAALSASVGGVPTSSEAITLTSEKSEALFTFRLTEDTPFSEIALSWTDSTASEIRFENLEFSAMGMLGFGDCGDNISWSLHGDGTLTVEGEGAMYDYEITDAGSTAPWAEFAEFIIGINVGEGVTAIGNAAFANLNAVVGEIALPDTLTAIGHNAFANCTGIAGITELPGGLETIGASAFAGCSAIDGTLFIPESVTAIGASAFEYCGELDSARFESRTTEIGERAFNGTNGDFTIYAYANSTAQAYANENGITFEAVREVLYYGYCGTSAKWEVWSDGVLAISGTGAMKSYTDGTDTPWYAYRDMITSIEVYSGITTIGNCAFRFLGNVETATLPDTLTAIGKYAFDYAEKLESVNIPDKVTSIGDWAFGYCRALTEIVLPDSVTSLGDYLFYKCTSLETAKLPSDITAINDGMFENCYSLKYISWERGITTIGETAFAGCTSLNYVVIPESVTSIGAGAFRECEWLYTMMIPESVTEIGAGAFDVCPNVIVFGYEDSAAEAYANANGHNFTAIELEVIAEGEFGDGLAWTIYENGKLNISGKGAMPDYTADAPAPWFEYRRHFTTVVIDSGVTSIGDYAFFRCIGVDQVFIPGTVKSIGDYAFTYCSELVAIAIPTSVNAIGEGAFYGCVALERINIPEGVTAIEDYTFDGCTALAHVTFPSTLKTIGTRAFWGCSALTELAFNNGLTSIGDYAFRNCMGLVEIEIPRTVKNIGTFAFADLHFAEIVRVLSSDAVFGDNVFIYSPNIVVYGYEGSTAQTYASAKKHTFVVMEQTTTDITEEIESSMVAPTTATVTAPMDGWIEGENTFTVFCDKVCHVFVSNDGGVTYERLIATANASGSYDFTTELTAESKIVVRIFADLSGDGKVSSVDLNMLKRILKGTYSPDTIDGKLSDMNDDGRISSVDLNMLKRSLKGTYTGYTW